MLPSERFAAPEHFSIAIKPMDGVAYTTGTDVFASEKWIESQIDGEAVGSLIHEAVHVVQQFEGKNPDKLAKLKLFLNEHCSRTL